MPWPKLAALSDRQSLIVVHGDDRVVALRELGHEHRVGRHRACHVVPRGARGGDGRGDDVDFLPPQVPALAGVRVEAADRDARGRQRELRAKLGADDGERRFDRLPRDGRRDVLQREVRGDERDAQRRVRRAADEHHDDARRVRCAARRIRYARRTGCRRPGARSSAPGPSPVQQTRRWRRRPTRAAASPERCMRWKGRDDPVSPAPRWAGARFRWRRRRARTTRRRNRRTVAQDRSAARAPSGRRGRR